MSTIRTLLTVFIALCLNGCIDVAILGGTYAVRSSDRDELQVLAEGGDIDAQYQLGKQWCCFGPGFDTQIATEWLCKSAKAGHMEAQYQLGRIYQGGIFRIPAFGPKMMSLVFGKESDADAYLWYSLASDQGHVKASKKLDNLADKLTDADQAMVNEMKADLSAARCEHRQVFPEKYDDPLPNVKREIQAAIPE